MVVRRQSVIDPGLPQIVPLARSPARPRKNGDVGDVNFSKLTCSCQNL